jgi:lysophospholipase L1-like esterase
MFRILLLLLFTIACYHSQAQDLTIPTTENIRYLALGDSYTIGQGVMAAERWPEQFRDSLEATGYGFDTLRFIAATGWNTGSLLNIKGKGLAGQFDLVSLLIGVNNQFQGGSITLYADQFEQLLDSAIVYAGGNSQAVFVLSIPDYAYTPGYQNDPQISQAIDQFNTVNRQICQQRNIPYFDITGISRDNNPALITGDNLHPSRYQYSLWVQSIMQTIPRLLTATTEELADRLTIYPVPATQNINIQADPAFFEALQSLEFLRADGGAVLHMPQGTDRTSYSDRVISLPTRLASGMYFLRMTTSTGETLVKQVPVLR